jgi:hypothetical protein
VKIEGKREAFADFMGLLDLELLLGAQAMLDDGM